MKKGILAAKQEKAVNKIEKIVQDMSKAGLVDQSEIDTLTALRLKKGDIYQMKRLESIAAILAGIQANLAARPDSLSVEDILAVKGLSKTSAEAIKKALS